MKDKSGGPRKSNPYQLLSEEEEDYIDNNRPGHKSQQVIGIGKQAPIDKDVAAKYQTKDK